MLKAPRSQIKTQRAPWTPERLPSARHWEEKKKLRADLYSDIMSNLHVSLFHGREPPTISSCHVSPPEQLLTRYDGAGREEGPGLEEDWGDRRRPCMRAAHGCSSYLHILLTLQHTSQQTSNNSKSNKSEASVGSKGRSFSNSSR